MPTNRHFIYLTLIATVLAFFVIVLGAYVRLSHAGLGCPDWPGCYGRMVMPLDEEVSVALKHDFKERPVEHGKAWKEMIHRYAAGTLGLVILMLLVLAWKGRNTSGQSVKLPVILVLLVIFQALLGMWTVTLLLKPVIVMGHLIGGMTLLSLLFWMLLRSADINQTRVNGQEKIIPWAIAAITMVAIQIVLGGWTSANYAALVCPDFPTCQGKWWPQMDFLEGFVLWRGLGIDYEGGVLGGEARAAIHMSHRLGALLTLVIVGAVVIKTVLTGNTAIRAIGAVIGIVLLLQITLGITNIIKVIPISVAVAHNGMAAVLLLCLITLLNFITGRKRDGNVF